jgi:hypothetical protein
MNKKLLPALLIPMMLLPMTGFAYAHWTDAVFKQIKLHVGTVDIHIPWWHVNELNTMDVNCNGEIFGDEFRIGMVEDETGQVKGLLLYADPVYPGWRLNFKFLVHNKGRLNVRSYGHFVFWEGPLEEDPCWVPWDQLPVKEGGDVITPAPPGFEYIQELFIHNYVDYPDCRGIICTDYTHYDIPVSPTTYMLKPCESVLIRERIVADIQEYEEYQCHWFRLVKLMVFVEDTGEVVSSWGWTSPRVDEWMPHLPPMGELPGSEVFPYVTIPTIDG